MRRLILISLSVLLLVSCERRLNQAMRSNDKVFVLKTAELYELKKSYPQAITLYEHATKLAVGTDDAPEIAYKMANLNFLDKNYRLAAHQFKNFRTSYPRDSRVEMAAYMVAYCYYKDSPDYNLDQTNTFDALKELQNFIDSYPNSMKVAECNQMIDQLTQKLEKKALENAKTLYKITEYKAAIVSLDNVLEDYPDTKLKEEVQIYQLRSKTELATNSIQKLKNERANDGLKTYRTFVSAFPQSKYLDEAERLKNRLEKAQEDYLRIEKENKESQHKNKVKDSDKNKIS